MILVPKYHGIIAEFDTPADILAAARTVRDAGFTRWDVFTPFPVHGMNEAMRLKNSAVGWFALVFGMGAFFNVIGLVWYAGYYDYPIMVGGKPLFSAVCAFTPAYIMFVLGASVGALAGMLALNRLPQLYHPLLKNARFARASHDKFFLVVEAADPKFNETETRRLLERAGSRHTELAEA
jgi:Protein of unknown function (DUF3341)